MSNTATFTASQIQSAFSGKINKDNYAGLRELVRVRLNANTNEHFELMDVTVRIDGDLLFHISATNLSSQQILDAINQG